MRPNQNRITMWAVAALLSLGLSRNGVAQTSNPPDTVNAPTVETVHLTAYRTKGPIKVPVARSETKGKAPAANAVWIPGYWDLRADRNTAPQAGWVWMPGRWATPPAKAARWDPAHWGWANEWWSWIPGHWVLPGKDGYPPSLETDQMSQLEISQ
jgi:WXXGXW repeat (2 copies)